MRQRFDNIYHLGVKELLSLRYDPVLVFLIFYAFTIFVYVPAKNAAKEFRNATIAIVDEDQSPLSKRIGDAFLEPYFLTPQHLPIDEIDVAMDSGKYTFVVDIPPDFQADLLAGRKPVIQVNVDATAMTQAGNGASYIHSIISQEINEFVHGGAPKTPVDIVIRVKFNPNLKAAWFESVVQIINGITMLAVILSGAAFVREREHGTIEHLMVLPLKPAEIMIAKVWANGLVIVSATTLSLWLVVQGVLEVPIAGSVALFLLGTVIYLFSVTALGIFLATIARSMPQFGLLAIPVIILMMLLSGGTTPLNTMPKIVQYGVQIVPSTHFVSFAQAILYRGAGFDIVWPSFATVAAIGALFFTGALLRFRASVAVTRS